MGDAMKKTISNNKISFCDDNGNEIMYMDYLSDECVWCFNSNDINTITEDMELFELLKLLMNQNYVFGNNEILESYKKDNKLVWYSDCYYNPDDEWGIKSVSYLNIEYINNSFKLWCVKPLDEIIDRKQTFHCICFSPMGNGKYNRNIVTGLTLQDDFITMVYHTLIKKEKVKKLK